MSTHQSTHKVYEAISKVSEEIARDGISKTRKNAQQGYQFRGIDDVYNAIAPLLPKHGLVIIPKTISREVTERQAKNGTALFYVVVECEFTFVSTVDGSMHTAKTYGEAMDSGDKATNKAMSAAYKYMAMQVFCIPTEGDNDTENTTHIVAPNNHTPVAATLKNEDIKITDLSRHIANEMKRYLSENEDYKVLELVEDLDNDEKIAIWSLLDSKERAAIKKIQQEART